MREEKIVRVGGELKRVVRYGDNWITDEGQSIGNHVVDTVIDAPQPVVEDEPAKPARRRNADQ